MKVHSSRVRYAIELIVPIVLFLMMVGVLSSKQRLPSGAHAFVSDDAYRHLVVAQTLFDERSYGISGDDPVPILGDALWPRLISFGMGVGGHPFAVSRALGILFGILTLALMMRLAHRIAPTPAYRYAVAGLMVLTPGLAYAAISGLPYTLATALLAGIMLQHDSDVRRGRGVVGTRIALWMGFAILLRVEFVAVWFVLVTHAFFVSLLPHRGHLSPALVVVRSLNGLLIMSLFLLPYIAWNMAVVDVPWPRLAGTPMSANEWVQGGGSALGQLIGLSSMAMREGAGRVFSIGLAGSAILLLLFLTGALFMTWQSLRNPRKRHVGASVSLLVLLPIFFAFMYPFIGWEGFDLLVFAAHPLALLVVAFGVMQAPLLLFKWMGTSSSDASESTAHAVHWVWRGVGIVLCAMAAFWAHDRESRRVGLSIAETSYIYDVVHRDLERMGVRRWDHVHVTDRPGWLRYAEGVPVLDLTGKWSPRIVRHVDAQTALYPSTGPADDQARALFIIWDRTYAGFVEHLSGVEYLDTYDGTDPRDPIILQAGWPGVL